MTVEFTPDVIRSTTFRENRRGYNSTEVDAFVQLMAGAVDVLQSRLTEETERALKAEGALEQNSDTDDSVRRTLVLAQRTAALAVAEAKDDAARVRNEALAEAGTIHSDADAAAHRLVADAAESAALALADASRQRAEAEEECGELRRKSASEIAEAESSSAAGIAAARREADAALAKRAEEGRQQLDRTITTLTAQRADLRADIEGLANYLAMERARVLAVLTTARDEFGQTLSPSPQPSAVIHAEAGPPGARSPYSPESGFEESPARADRDAGGDNPAGLPPGPDAGIPVVSDPVPVGAPAPDGGAAPESHDAVTATLGLGQADLALTPDVRSGHEHGDRPETAASREAVSVTTRPDLTLSTASPRLGTASDKRPSALLFTLEHDLRPGPSRGPSAVSGARDPIRRDHR